MRTLYYLMLLSPWWSCSQSTMPVYSVSDTAITIQAGSKFAVQLPSNIGTGYRWELKESLDSTVLSLQKREHHPGNGQDDNSGGRDYFLFEAHRKAELQLSFWYIRPWLKDKVSDPNTKEKAIAVSIQ